MHITIATAARACARSLAVMAITTLTTVAAAQTAATGATLQQQRTAFRAAYAAAQQGQPWEPLAQGLTNYPLYPYLEAAELEHNIQTASESRIDAYLKRYAGLIPADELRRAALEAAAQQKDWTRFEHFYQAGLGAALTCDDLQARLAGGQPLDFQRDLGALWQRTSLPAVCTPVLNAAFAQGLLTPTRVWDRIHRAATALRSATIKQSIAWLPAADAAAAQRFIDAIEQPKALLQAATALPDTPEARAAIALALNRYARRDSADAAALWQALAPHFQFDATQRDAILAVLALYNAVDLGPDAAQRLAALPSAAQTDATREWRVRAAVAAGNWQAASAAIAALTPAEMQHDEWRYWQARIAEKLGEASTAQADFSSLANVASFYGFLAADRANLPYSICPATITPDAATDQQIETIPGFARAFEFFALGMLPAARREWNRAFPDLAPAEQQQAAALAARRGWVDRAVFAFAKSGDLHYYALRFPLADRQRVLDAARSAGINPAWAFAIIRAETAWQPDARSGADARGLMQLVPGTASRVARRSGLAYGGADSLYDPAINIPLGTRYLADLAGRFSGSPWLATAAYNAGPANAQRWIASRGRFDPEVFIFTIPFNETRDYVTRVLSFATIYGWRLDGRPLPVSSRLPAVGAAYDPPANAARKQVVCRAAPATSNQGSP